MFTRIETAVKGYKTYIVATLLVLVAVVNFIDGGVALTDLLNDPNLLILLNGLGLAALRGGVGE